MDKHLKYHPLHAEVIQLPQKPWKFYVFGGDSNYDILQKDTTVYNNVELYDSCLDKITNEDPMWRERVGLIKQEEMNLATNHSRIEIIITFTMNMEFAAPTPYAILKNIIRLDIYQVGETPYVLPFFKKGISRLTSCQIYWMTKSCLE